MTFKEQIRSDINTVFMNVDEFAVEHTVNGKRMPVMVDNNELIDRVQGNKSNMNGLFTKTNLIYVKAKDFGPLPAVGSVLVLDGLAYRITDATNEDGLFSIHLEANRS